MSKTVSTFGNLQSYFQYTRPSARQLFGAYSFRKKHLWTHQQKVQQMLEILALHGTLTTWEMAKIETLHDSSSTRAKDKEFRRLLVGRKDRGKSTSGVLDTGLVVSKPKLDQDSIMTYRLSLHGILYCLDVLDLSEKQIDTMAEKYSSTLPWIFGRWDLLKKILGHNVYQLKILASGYTLDNSRSINLSNLPIFELSNYLNSKYQNYYENIEEDDLANQVSYWFYTNLLAWYVLNDKNKNKLKKWQEIFVHDKKLAKWYFGFVDEAIVFFKNRLDNASNIKLGN
jgi:hypothetical protein